MGYSGTIGDVFQRQPSSSAVRRFAATWVRRDRPQWWVPAVIALGSLYVVYTLSVLAGSWLTELDSYLYDLHMIPQQSPLHLPMQLWVLLGQRVPAMIVTGLYVVYRARKMRSLMPLVIYSVGAVGFVLSVMVLKYATGRVGPRFTDQAHTVWDGGNIFPSGHVTGTVVLYGVAAMAAPLAYRKIAATLAAVLSVTVGMGTVALNTHWFSDVVGGWMNGALVLLVSWAIAPEVLHRSTASWVRLRAWHHRVRIADALPFDTSALRAAGTGKHPLD